MSLKILISSYYKHVLHCVLMITVIVFHSQPHKSRTSGNTNDDPLTTFGTMSTIFLYALLSLKLLAAPKAIFHFCGLFFYNSFMGKVYFKGNPSNASLIAIRIVTRGSFPDLVKENVERNMKTCLRAGLNNFIIEVVTNRQINVPKNRRVREIVVPDDYRTKSGALFKARSLQYCLEDCVNELQDNDWIVHLDEETVLTEDSVRGIVNFALAGKHHFGQGLVTYTDLGIVNWLTTLADSWRVGDDMGVIRYQFKYFHKPVFSFKGTYVIAQVKAEKEVSYENGPDGSIAEDCYFALRAYQMGYTFDWVEGVLYESSPFTILDFLQQRKRWFQGIFLVLNSPEIRLKYKVFLGTVIYGWAFLPLTVVAATLGRWYPLPSLGENIDTFTGAIDGVYAYLYIFGVLKSFSIHRLGKIKFICALIGSMFVNKVNELLECIVVIWGLFGAKHQFFIVEKTTNKIK